MNIFDCTLRDGGNVVGNGFDARLTDSMVRGLISCGITEIELGNAKGLGAYAAGSTAPLNDEEYMDLVAPYTDKASLGMFLQANYADEALVHMAKEKGLKFLRVGTNAGDGAKAVEAVKMVKAAGLRCRYSQMKAYLLTPEQLADEAAMLVAAGVDAITIMDSAGTMFPEDAAAYVKALKAKVSVPVGFHGHNNLGLSQANAIAAIEAGADELDAGLLGMARSAGNCATELAAALLLRLGKFDEKGFYTLLSYLDHELIPMMAEHDYHVAVCPEDIVLGISGCHSSFLKLFHKVAEEEGVDAYQLIVKVSERDRKAPTEELMRAVAAELK